MTAALAAPGDKVLEVPADFRFQHAELYPRLHAPLAEVRAELERLHGLDKEAETKKAKLKPWLWVTGILTFLGFLTLVTFVFVIPFVFLAYKYFQLEKADIEDRRLDAARHLLDALESEIDPTCDQILEMDFRTYSKLTGVPSEGKTLYEQPWLRMGLVLTNGSALQVTATLLCKRKSKRKRKYTRHTDKLNEQVALEIRPPKGQSFDPGAQARVARMLQRPLPSARLRRCRLRPKVAELQFLTDLTVHTRPARPPRQILEGRHNLLDATKLLAMTTMGYRAALGAARAR